MGLSGPVDCLVNEGSGRRIEEKQTYLPLIRAFETGSGRRTITANQFTLRSINLDARWAAQVRPVFHRSAAILQVERRSLLVAISLSRDSVAKKHSVANRGKDTAR